MKKTLIILVCLSFIFNCSKTEKKPLVAKLSFIKGTVTLIRDGNSQDAEINTRLRPNDIIITSAKSEANILFANIGISKIKANSEVGINNLFKSKQGDLIEMSVKKGKLASSLKKLIRTEDNFLVNTPTAVVGVRGTTFLVIVIPAKESKVAVFSGKVDITDLMGKAQPISVEEFKEAILPQLDLSKARVVTMRDSSYRDMVALNQAEELSGEGFEEVQAELIDSKAEWEKVNKTQAPATQTKKEDEKLKW